MTRYSTRNYEILTENNGHLRCVPLARVIWTSGKFRAVIENKTLQLLLVFEDGLISNDYRRRTEIICSYMREHKRDEI